jgi:hypothetical protein
MNKVFEEVTKCTECIMDSGWIDITSRMLMS